MNCEKFLPLYNSYRDAKIDFDSYAAKFAAIESNYNSILERLQLFQAQPDTTIQNNLDPILTDFNAAKDEYNTKKNILKEKANLVNNKFQILMEALAQ